MQEEKNYAGLIPDEREGWAITATHFRDEANTTAAKTLFSAAATRLLDVNHWANFLKGKLATFQLFDAAGEMFVGTAKEGHYIQIDIVGPGTSSGEGYDWVQVEAIGKFDSGAVDHIAMRVRPASKPGSPEEPTAHFYDEKSTSTFTITREGTRVTASIYDRNTAINTEGQGIADKARNVLFGLFGKLAFSKIQWQDFADGILDM